MHPDAERWNARYVNDLDYYLQREPYQLVTTNIGLIPEHGAVLDAACGVSPLGEFLIDRGLNVVALDASFEAVNAAKTRLLSKELDLACAVLDLSDPWLPASYFTAVFNFYFLSRPLLTRFRRALKPGGFFFCELLLWDANLGSNKQHYLQPGEMERRFVDWKFHYLTETSKHGRKNSPDPRRVLQMIAQKPG